MVLVCLPYLSLKIAWALGSTIGVNSATFADATRGANLLTAALEVIAILLALAFVHPRGQRVPAFAVAFPTWIATGLLTPVVGGFLIGTPVHVLSGGGNPFEDDVLSGWVFLLVYGGFVLQAALLLAGFVLYARDRWPVAAGGGREGAGRGATRSLQDLLLGLGAAAALLFAGQQIWWAVRGGGSFTDPDPAQRVLLVANGLLAVGAAAAMWRLVTGGRLGRSVLALVWTGTAVVFVNSLTDTLKVVAIPAGEWGAVDAGGGAALTLFVLLAALGGAIGGAARLVEEERPSHQTENRSGSDARRG